jgi:ribonuclease P protein component
LAKQFTFPKSAKLKSTVHISWLLQNGEAFFIHPFRVVYQAKPLPNAGVIVAITVPKKKHKLAVSRNRVKRLCREAWRHYLPELNSIAKAHNLNVCVILQYTTPQILLYTEVNAAIALVSQQLAKRLNTNA